MYKKKKVEPTQERMYKKKKVEPTQERMHTKKKEADRGGPSTDPTDDKDEEMDFKKIMKDIEHFSNFLALLITLLCCFSPIVCLL